MSPAETLHLPAGPAAGPSKAVRGDLRLLLAEVGQFLAQVRAYLAGPEAGAIEDLRHKLAYISTLALWIRNQNYDLETAGADEDGRRLYHGLAAITGRLARISELALNVARQHAHLSRPDFLDDYDLADFFDEIDLGLSLIRPALSQRKIKQAVRLCQLEEKLDARYADRFARLVRELTARPDRAGDLVTTLMVVHYLERIGDILLEIGEELIHIFLGEQLKFSQYQALSKALSVTGGGRPEAFQSIWSGRSGCRIGVVGPGDALGGQVGEVAGEPVIFKHGPAAKLEKERENLETWARLWPGLPPAVRAFVPAEGGGEAALVLEFIRGSTLKDMFLLPDNHAALDELTGALHIMADIWRETRVDGETRAGFVRQAEKRLGPVRALYPELVNFEGALGGLRIRSLADLMAEAAPFERDLPAPFAVRIHGDFNLSNLMRDDARGRYRFIDLYRSRLSDYAQDLSVMILSILRLPLARAAERERLSLAARRVWTFGRDFAASQHDHTLEARLTFGLARSYLTSARFEPRRGTAARFLGYSRHLWEKLMKYGRSGRSWAEFKLDKSALYV